MRVQWAAISNADGVELWPVDNVLGRCAPVAKGCIQRHADGADIGCRDTEGGGSGANLGDEVSDFVDVKAHVSVGKELISAMLSYVEHARGGVWSLGEEH